MADKMYLNNVDIVAFGTLLAAVIHKSGGTLTLTKAEIDAIVGPKRFRLAFAEDAASVSVSIECPEEMLS